MNHLTILIHKHVQFGQALAILGDSDQLGNWNPQRPLKMSWSQNDIWYVTLSYEKQSFMEEFNYKYLILQENNNQIINWEQGPQRIEDIWNQREIVFELNAKYQGELYLNQLGQRPQRISMEYHNKLIIQIYTTKIILDVSSQKNNQIDMHYLYSDQDENWERGGSRILKDQSGKGVVIYQNSKIIKKDYDLSFQLNYNQILPNIWVGTYIQDKKDIQTLKQHGINAIFSLQTHTDSIKRGKDQEFSKKIDNLCQTNDIIRIKYGINDIDPDDFIKKGYKALKLFIKLLDKGLNVYIHCTSGIFRSASLVALYLNSQMGYDLEKAVQLIIQKRSQAKPNKQMLQVVKEMYAI